VIVVGIVVDVLLEVVEVEVLVESVDVLPVVVVSANGLSGPAAPALAK